MQTNLSNQLCEYKFYCWSNTSIYYHRTISKSIYSRIQTVDCIVCRICFCLYTFAVSLWRTDCAYNDWKYLRLCVSIWDDWFIVLLVWRNRLPFSSLSASIPSSSITVENGDKISLIRIEFSWGKRSTYGMASAGTVSFYLWFAEG